MPKKLQMKMRLSLTGKILYFIFAATAAKSPLLTERARARCGSLRFVGGRMTVVRMTKLSDNVCCEASLFVNVRMCTLFLNNLWLYIEIS